MTHTPDMRDRVPQGFGVYAVNSKIEPALPNIFGSFGLGQKAGYNFVGGWYGGSGAFYHISSNINASVEIQGSITDNNRSMGFDASRCSSIYKNDCTTVQPPALAVAFYIKAK